MLDGNNLKKIIRLSLTQWSGAMNKDPDMSNRDKSREWIKSLANRLLEHCKKQNLDIEIFPPVKGKENKTYKNRNEFLFDIHVCETAIYKSRVHKKDVPFVSKSLVAIESEFEKNTYDAAEDMSKLICSNSEYRIFIGPYYERKETSEKDSNYLDPLIEVARHIPDLENFYFVLIPHPEDIVLPINIDLKFRILQLIENEWKDL